MYSKNNGSLRRIRKKYQHQFEVLFSRRFRNRLNHWFHPRRVRHYKGLLPFHLDQIHQLTHFNPKGVIHAGAHYGAEVPVYDLLNVDNIHLFEPQSDIFQLLQENHGHKKNVHLFNSALGATDGVTLPIHREEEGSPNLSGSASLLKPKNHLTDFPGVKFEATPSQQVEVNTLDSYQIKNADFLVMDTQGYELEVLKGAQQTLTHIKWIIFEYWKNEAYEKCVLETEIENFVEEQGFQSVLKIFGGSTGDCLAVRPEFIR